MAEKSSFVGNSTEEAAEIDTFGKLSDSTVKPLNLSSNFSTSAGSETLGEDSPLILISCSGLTKVFSDTSSFLSSADSVSN